MTRRTHLPDSTIAGSRARAWHGARLILLGAALVVVLAACGQAPSIILTLDSAGAELLRGAQVQVEVTLTRAGGASADVALAVTGLPANVSAGFSPVTLSGGAVTSTLTLSADAAAAEGSYEVSVTGTGTGLTDTALLTLDVVSLSVTGRLVSLYGLPVGGVAVRSQGDTAVTDIDGSFSMTGLSVPYDLGIWNTAAEWVHVFEGLTAKEPTLSSLVAPPPTPTVYSTGVSGTLSGGVIPVAVDQVVVVCLEGVDGFVMGCDTVTATETSYSLTAQWLTDPTRAVRIHALQFQRDVDDYPVSYQGYATMGLNVTNGVPTVVDLDLGGELATTAVTVGVTSPLSPTNVVAAVALGPNLTMPVVVTTSAAATFQFLMPVIGDATYAFAAMGTSLQAAWQAGVTGSSVTLTVPTVPTLTSPADGATGITMATEFTVTNPAGGPNTIMWSEAGGDLTVVLTTMKSTTTIPDLTPFGLALPTSTGVTWSVFGHSGSSTEAGADFLTDYFNLSIVIGGGSAALEGQGAVAVSDTHTFTTAP